MKICLGMIVVVLSGACATWANDQTFSWQKNHANIAPTGDIQWSPRPFAFETGPSVRYIDYAGGSDDRDGLTRESAWQHHPWDSQATGVAQQSRGIHTYVFKRGVTYRGSLRARESSKDQCCS